MRVLNFRLWSLKTKVIWAILVAAAIIAGAVALGSTTGTAPVVSLGVAVSAAAFVSTGMSSLFSYRRSRREATLDAWIKWSDENHKARVQLTADLGPRQITKQAQSLVDAHTQLLNQKEVSEDLRKIIANMTSVLNGLERLAAGVLLDVYDLRMLRNLGGTTVVRTVDRFQPYIVRRINNSNLDGRQARAFANLLIVADLLRRRDVLAQSRTIDNRRIEILRP